MAEAPCWMPMFAAPDAKGQPKIDVVTKFAVVKFAVMKFAVLAVVTPFALASTADDAFGETPGSVALEGATISLLSAPPIATALLANVVSLSEGEQLMFLSVDLNKGWKTYWRLPGRFGLAPNLDWQDSDNVAAATAHFPAPILFDEADGSSIGYAEPTVWPIVLRPEATSRPMIYRLSLEIGLCAVLCLPERVELSARPESSSAAENMTLAQIFDLQGDLAQGTQPLSELALEQVGDQIVLTSGGTMQNERAQTRPEGAGFAVAEDDLGRHSLLQPTAGEAGEIHTMRGPWSWRTPITRVTIIEPGSAVRIYADKPTSVP
jgi:DsbC/DsbD-like thiol-disulfide interchange protein